MVISKFSSVWGKNVYNVLQQNNNKERYSVGRDCALPMLSPLNCLFFFYRLLVRNSKHRRFNLILKKKNDVL